MSQAQSVEDEVEKLRTLLFTQIKKRKEMADQLDQHEDRIEELEEENEQLRAEIEQATNGAKAAIKSAKQHNGGVNKTAWAKETTRNVLITKAAQGAALTQRHVTSAYLKERAQPDFEIYHQQIQNGWEQLTTEWDCFYQTEKDGRQAMNVRKEQVPESLVALVQNDLERDDLTKGFFSENGVRGGQNH